MRHILHRPGLSRGLARHRPRSPHGGRADRAGTRGTDIVLAIFGLMTLGGFCLLVAARVIGPTLSF